MATDEAVQSSTPEDNVAEKINADDASVAVVGDNATTADP